MLNLSASRYYVFLLLALFAEFCVAQGMPAAQVKVVQVSEMMIAPTAQYKGNVLALQDATLSVEVEGQIEDVLYVGDVVNEGKLLAKIDKQRQQWQLIRKRATLDSLRADLAFRNGEVERFKQLASRDNASKNQLQKELVLSEMLTQQIKAAEADVAEAQKALNDTRIKAPFSGVIVERFAQVGEFIRVGQPLVRLVNDSLKDISLSVPIRYRQLVKQQAELEVFHHGKTYTLPIRSVLPIGNSNTRMIEVRLNANQHDLVIGDAVMVAVPTASASTEIALPRDAMVQKGNQTFVYRVDNDSIAQQVPVKLRYGQGDWIVVDGEISAGDNVIVRGAERIQPNSPVVVLDE